VVVLRWIGFCPLCRKARAEELATARTLADVIESY